MLQAFAEPEAGIYHDPRALDAGLAGQTSGSFERSGDLTNNVPITWIFLHRLGRSAHMHENDRRFFSREKPCEFFSRPKTMDVIDDGCPLIEDRGSDFVFMRVARDGDLDLPRETLEHGEDP